MSTTTTESTTCPSWCRKHAANEPPGSHMGATWRGYGLSVQLNEQPDDGASVEIDNDRLEYMSLTETQAHELGLQLVRAAGELRRSRMGGQA